MYYLRLTEALLLANRQDEMTVHIYYDGDCPFCSRYVQLLRLRASLGEPVLVNVRQDAAALKQLNARGLDLDQGMAVKLRDQWYDGDKAIHVLASLGTASTGFNRVNHALFSSPLLARLAYPLLRGGRNTALFLLGRQRLATESAESTASLILFNAAWGLFAVLHAISYAFFFNSKVFPSTVLIGILGGFLLLRPHDMRIFCALLAMFVLDAWLQMPLGSNHTIIKNFLLLGMLAAGVRQWLKGGGWSDFYADFAPAGRVLLVVMYVFGVFHKINRDFLDPAVSCAVTLWHNMPAPLNLIDNPTMHALAIYGTFVVEGLILIFLLLRSTRHWGIGVGIAFHSLLAMSSFALYVQFSMLTVALHLLFIERKAALRIVRSPFWQRLYAGLHLPRGLTLLIAWIALMTALTWNSSYSQVAIVWLPSVLLLAWACLARGQGPALPSAATSLLWSRNMAVNLISALFFLNCTAPYLGLKSAQSINMFANLQLEGGRSNHLVFTHPPSPFGYLADVVTVTESEHSRHLGYIRQHGLQMTYYGLLDHLERHPRAVASFERGDQVLQRQNASTLDEEIRAVLHPRWMRNWFHFYPVDPTSPKPCALDR